MPQWQHKLEEWSSRSTSNVKRTLATINCYMLRLGQIVSLAENSHGIDSTKQSPTRISDSEATSFANMGRNVLENDPMGSLLVK